MHTFHKGKSPTWTAAELMEPGLLFLRKNTEKVAARLKLFLGNVTMLFLVINPAFRK